MAKSRSYQPTVAAHEVPKGLPVMLQSSTCASIAGVSAKHIRDLAKEGQIPGAVKVGATWRFGRDAFLTWLGLSK